jgi:hypothetical protein
MFTLLPPNLHLRRDYVQLQLHMSFPELCGMVKNQIVSIGVLTWNIIASNGALVNMKMSRMVAFSRICHGFPAASTARHLATWVAIWLPKHKNIRKVEENTENCASPAPSATRLLLRCYICAICAYMALKTRHMP